MKYPAVLLNGRQARAVGRGFAKAVRESGYAIHACSILDDHVHLVIAPGRRTFEEVVRHLRGKASMQLRAEVVRSSIPPSAKGARDADPGSWTQRKPAQRADVSFELRAAW